MSKKTELQADLKRVGYQLNGGHLTWQGREATFKAFARTMRELGYSIQAADQIGGKHLQAYAQHRKAHGVSSRTLAKEMSHLRAVLMHIGKQGLARNPAYSNQALGVGRGSRVGTKQPLSDEAIKAFQERMARLGRPSFGNILEMQRELGLRESEAIRAGQQETLARWERELQERGSVRVFEGTKGGRSREVHPANVGRALKAVQRAQAILEATGQPYLLVRADGSVTTGLKQALKIYSNICSHAGIQSHGARYAFAQERMQAYRDQGYSAREARAATSMDLGHGEGAGATSRAYMCAAVDFFQLRSNHETRRSRTSAYGAEPFGNPMI